MLRVELVHGFMPEHFVANLPIVSVYGDGRVITEGPTIAIDPRPALPNVLVRRLSPAGVNALVARSLSHGVGRNIDLGQPDIYDAPGTRFTVLTDWGLLVTDVYALDFTHERDGLTDAQRSARRTLRDLVDDLTDLPKTLGQESGSEEPYEPIAIAAISREWTLGQSQSERAWPSSPALPGERMGHLPRYCLTVTGAHVAPLLDAAGTANIVTPWTSDGRTWQVEFRPLLPDETSCADLP